MNTNVLLTNMVSDVVTSTFTTGARFCSLTYTNQNGETSRHTLLLGVKIEGLYKSDLLTLKKTRKTLTGIKLVACDELINSITESLTKGIGNNSAYTLKGYYTPITPNGEVKLHTDENGVTNFYIRGYVTAKTVLVNGTYPKVNSSEKTLAKKELEHGLKRGKIRTFKLNVNDVHQIKMNGITIEFN